MRLYDRGDDPYKSTNTTSMLAPPVLQMGGDIDAVLDFNGDGWPDLITNEGHFSKAKAHYSKSLVQDKIVRFNEFGVDYAVEYRPASDKSVYARDNTPNMIIKSFPYKQITPKRYLVAQVLKQPKGYEATRYQYHYQGARTHLQGGGFLGFASITETETASVVTRTQTKFVQQNLKQVGEPSLVFVHKAERNTPDKQLMASMTSYAYHTETYQGDSAEYYQTYADKIVTTSYSGNFPIYDKRESTTRTRDRYGNITYEDTEFTSGYADAGSYSVSTGVTYLSTHYNAPFWHLSAPIRITTRINDGSSSRVTLDTMSYHTNGLLKTHTIQGNAYGSNNTPTSSHLKTIYTYDAYGNVITSTVSGTELSPRITRFTYKDGLYPEATINAKKHVESTTYDANGRLITVISALKGRTTTYDYDEWGRVTKETLPGIEHVNTVNYKLGADCPYATTSTVSCTIRQSATGSQVIKLLDYAEREIASLHQGFNGQWINTSTTWDLSGRKISASRPYFVKQLTKVPLVTFEYDVFNRETIKSEPLTNGGRAMFSYRYNGLTTERIDAKGESHFSTVNVMGYVTHKKEPLEASQSYQYYPDGKLYTSTNSSGDTTTIHYDSLGHRTKLIDPDIGTWWYTYNILGELVYKRDANGVVTTIEYDTLGRKVKQTEGKSTSIWHYDGNFNEAPGTLTYVIGRGQKMRYTYNDQGLTEEVFVTVGDETFSTHYRYDHYERVTQEKRPNGGSNQQLVIQNVYNSYGYLSAIRSPYSDVDQEFSSARFRGEIQQLLDQAITLATTYLDLAGKYAEQNNFYVTQAQVIREGTLNEHQLDIASSASVKSVNRFTQWCSDGGACYLRPMSWMLIGTHPTTTLMPVVGNKIYRFQSLYQGTSASTRLHNSSLIQVSETEFNAATLTKAHDLLVKELGDGQFSLVSEEDIYVATPDDATQLELNYTAQELDEVAELATIKYKHYVALADRLITVAEKVAVLSGLYCDDAKRLGGRHAHMVNLWGNCSKPNEQGHADHLQLVLDQSELAASVENGAYFYYWQRGDTDAYDHTLYETLGNGLLNRYDYHETTGRPETIVTHRGSETIRELHYRYDEHNNVTYRNDLYLGITDNWTYDSLDRVVTNRIGLIDKTRHGTNNADLNTVFNYRYDNLGNIVYKTGVGSYQYSGVYAGPHAVTNVNGLNYQYDEVGNVVRAYYQGRSTSERTIIWTEFNKPASIMRNGQKVEFYYDANHNRYLKKSSDGSETFYFGKTYERTKLAEGEVQHKHFVYAEGKLIALNTQIRDSERKLKNKQVRYLHYDALNSVDMISDGYGNIVERRSYDTWGKQRLISWRADSLAEVLQAKLTNRGYTGHEHIDEVGLIHMNGRVYDPELGRFLSADPFIQEPYLTNSFNRYSYVMNNPVKYTDPTGYWWQGGLEGECQTDGNNYNYVNGTVHSWNSSHNGSESGVRNGGQNDGESLDTFVQQANEWLLEVDKYIKQLPKYFDINPDRLVKMRIMGEIYHTGGYNHTLKALNINEADTNSREISLAIAIGVALKGVVGRGKGLSGYDVPKGTGPYKTVKGHHVHAKAAFKDHVSYSNKDGFSISQKFMKENGLDHAAMTKYQRQAFKELNQSGRPNTLKEHTTIAVDALMAGGASRETARSLTAQSLNALRNSSVRTPTNIPWYK